MLATVQQTLDSIHANTSPLAPAITLLSDSLGLVLAEPIHLDIDSPPFNRAQLDGFAVRSADVTPQKPLHIIATINAGSPPHPLPIGPNECIAINTGAPVPAGADAILMIEHTTPGESPQTIIPTKTVKPHNGIQPQAADAKAGALLLSDGTLLTPAHLAIAATAGKTQLLTHPLPTITLLTTGDELVDPSQIPGPSQIRNSNHPLLHALVEQFAAPAHINILNLPPTPDEAPLLRERLTQALANSDLTLITGGMSMGTRDLIPPLLKQLVATFHIQKVAMKPGKPFIFATRDKPGDPRRYIAGLPGNPVSAFVTFHLFVKPLLNRLANRKPSVGGPTEALTTEPLPPNGDREFYLPCTLHYDGPTLRCTPLPWTSSANLFTLTTATALIHRPIQAPALPVSSSVPILPL